MALATNFFALAHLLVDLELIVFKNRQGNWIINVFVSNISFIMSKTPKIMTK